MLDLKALRRFFAMLAAMTSLSVLSACAAGSGTSPLPQGAAAYEVIPERVDNGELSEKIRAGDRLGIRIFGEPELSSENYRVDAVGYMQMPLIGELPVAGQTPRELRAEITRRLATRFIRDPQVAIVVLDRPRSTFTVEGAVESPGVFESNAGTTLLTALAQAKSPNKTAKLDEIMVFRVINGQRAGGRFNLSDIRRGRSPDPQILAGDTIVVGNSALKSGWRDFLAAAPLFNIFTFF